MKVNLGCGDLLMKDFVNVDMRDDVGADVVCDCLAPLPFEDDTVELLQAEDFLEHVPPDLLGPVLADWRRVLAPTGILRIKVPNLEALAREIIGAEPTFQAALIRNIYGGHRWGEHGALDCHHSGWTPVLLHLFLAQHGFAVVSNDRELNMRVTAMKTGPVPSERPLLDSENRTHSQKAGS